MIYRLAEKIEKMLKDGTEYAQCPKEHGTIIIKRYDNLMEIQLLIKDSKVMGPSVDKLSINRVDGITINEELDGDYDVY